MARINTNVGAIIAQRNLNTSYRNLNSTLERLSTGLRINHGKDDPAGLIVSERLRSEVSAVNQAIGNSQRAALIIATTEGAGRGGQLADQHPGADRRGGERGGHVR